MPKLSISDVVSSSGAGDCPGKAVAGTCVNPASTLGDPVDEKLLAECARAGGCFASVLEVKRRNPSRLEAAVRRFRCLVLPFR